MPNGALWIDSIEKSGDISVNGQYILAGIFAIGFVFTGLYVVTDGKIIPHWSSGEPDWQVQVTVIVQRGYTGSPTISITNYIIDKGHGFSVGPFIASAEYKIKLQVLKNGVLIDQITKPIVVDINSNASIDIGWLSMGENNRHCTLVAILYGPTGTIEAQTSQDI